MTRSHRLLIAGLAAGVCAVPAVSQAQSDHPSLSLARLVNTGPASVTATAAARQPNPLGLNPLGNFGLRLGGMVSPRGAGLVGVDATIPGLGFGIGFGTRVDADVIFKANFAGVNTIIPITVDQIYRSPSVAGKSFYLGAGVGAILSGPARLDGKLIGGAELTNKIGAELNIHFTEHDTLVTIMARLHM